MWFVSTYTCTQTTVLCRTIVHWKESIGSGSEVLNLVMVHNTEAISLYSDIDSCSFTTPARQLTCKALYLCTDNTVLAFS